jgi:hypothetical protein
MSPFAFLFIEKLPAVVPTVIAEELHAQIIDLHAQAARPLLPPLLRAFGTRRVELPVPARMPVDPTFQ